MDAIHVVALALVNENNQILVTQRPSDKELGGLWEFPGGKVEANETRVQALKREILEELDYTIKSAIPLKFLLHHYEKFSVNLDVWISWDQNPQVSSNEGQNMRWVSLEEIMTLDMPEADKPILLELEKQIEKRS